MLSPHLLELLRAWYKGGTPAGLAVSRARPRAADDDPPTQSRLPCRRIAHRFPNRRIANVFLVRVGYGAKAYLHCSVRIQQDVQFKRWTTLGSGGWGLLHRM